MRVFVTALVLCFAALPAAAEFRISFEWGDIPDCRTGNPNRVGSPAFLLKGVPAGTTAIEFKLTDLDVPSYNHGGGTVKVGEDGKLPAGLFKYKSPCPPDGVHTYEWTARAMAGRTVLAIAKATRRYPRQ